MTTSKRKSIVIIGGGPAGLSGAIAAAREARRWGLENRAEILLLEKQPRVGRKLLTTGNGRCNLANLSEGAGFYHSESSEVLEQCLESFSLHKVIDFLRSLGLLLCEEEGRLYPYSRQAAAVLDVLRWNAEEMGVDERCGCDVVDIKREGQRGFTLTLASGERIAADRVIVACGGLAAPQLGSGGGGYRLLRGCGHSMVPTVPALTPLKVAHGFVRSLKGIRVVASAELLTPVGECLRRERGEVLFTDYGVSGMAVMQLSRWVSGRAARIPPDRDKGSTNEESKVVAWLKLDLMEPWREDDVTCWLGERAENAPKRKLGDFLVGMVPKRVGQVLLKKMKLDLAREAGSLTAQERRAVAHMLKNWRLPVSSAVSWQHAQVTAGGIRLDGFAAQTLESLRVSGLYAAGEVLDVDGDCGGYNLQWAWTSGCLAGGAAARSLGDGVDGRMDI